MTALERITEWAESAALTPQRGKRHRPDNCICNCHTGDGETDHISTGKCYCRADLAGVAVPAMAAALTAAMDALSEHWQYQVRRESKFGRKGSSCVCDVCDAMRAIETALEES